MSLAIWVLSAIVGLLTAHVAVNALLLRRPPSRARAASGQHRRVSVLLPLRDEAHRVGPCLTALLDQVGVPELEILILDDGSGDGTADVVRRVAGADSGADSGAGSGAGSQVRLITGAPLPAGWLGKPHACHQLATAASGEVLAFVDADVVLAPDAIAMAVDMLGPLDLLSPYPRILAETWGERLVQPLLQWSWLTFLPMRSVERSRRPSLAAAGGQFLVVSRRGYDRAGGHRAVRDRVLEDIELARQVKRRGGRIALADGSRLATCRMYTGWAELVDGYTKSLWATVPTPVGAAAMVGLLMVLYVVPLLAAVAGVFLGSPGWVIAGLSGYGAGVFGRVLSGRATGGRVWPDALAHPASIVLFGWMMLRSWRRRGRGLTWKGRPVELAGSRPDR